MRKLHRETRSSRRARARQKNLRMSGASIHMYTPAPASAVQLAPNALRLPAPLPPIQLPSPKPEKTRHEVVFMGEVAWERVHQVYDTGEDEVGLCCGCFTYGRTQQHVVDVKVIRPPTVGDLSKSLPATVLHRNGGECQDRRAETDATTANATTTTRPDAITVSLSERTTSWVASPVLKGLLRSPFANGMRSVSRDKPGRLYGGGSLQDGTPRRARSEPVAKTEHERQESTTKRVAFSVHA